MWSVIAEFYAPMLLHGVLLMMKSLTGGSMKFLNPKLNATVMYNVVVPIYILNHLHQSFFKLQ
jgi:hypothetical protein